MGIYEHILDMQKRYPDVYRRMERSRRARENPIKVRLQRRLKSLGYDIDVPHRLYPGHWQRSAGAWVWGANQKNGLPLGSQYPMTDCLKMSTEELLKVLDET